MKYVIILTIFIVLILIFAGSKPATDQIQNISSPVKEVVKETTQPSTRPLLTPGFIPSRIPTEVRDGKATILFVADIRQAKVFAKKKLEEARARARAGAEEKFSPQEDSLISGSR